MFARSCKEGLIVQRKMSCYNFESITWQIHNRKRWLRSFVEHVKIGQVIMCGKTQHAKCMGWIKQDKIKTQYDSHSNLSGAVLIDIYKDIVYGAHCKKKELFHYNITEQGVALSSAIDASLREQVLSINSFRDLLCCVKAKRAGTVESFTLEWWFVK